MQSSDISLLKIFKEHNAPDIVTICGQTKSFLRKVHVRNSYDQQNVGNEVYQIYRFWKMIPDETQKQII